MATPSHHSDAKYDYFCDPTTGQCMKKPKDQAKTAQSKTPIRRTRRVQSRGSNRSRDRTTRRSRSQSRKSRATRKSRTRKSRSHKKRSRRRSRGNKRSRS